MADDQNRISLSSDELKALDLLISVAQSQGVNPAENLSFITAIAQTIVNVARQVIPVVQRVVPVVQQIAPVVAQMTPLMAAGAFAGQQFPQGGQGIPPNVTLNDLMELRRRANQ
jgi:hypothetical protein